MKIRVSAALAFGLFILGATAYIGNNIFKSALNYEQTTKPVTALNVQANRIDLIRNQTTLRRGDAGIITIKAKPNTTYTIKTSYKMNGRTINVTQSRSTDASGEATFNWVVDKKTDLGTQNAVIYGGGETLNLSHTVIQ
ncbi:hypothetical protein HMPREF1982_04653 [Clostridiales bacterium oral taxon 876 str. F0540]|nr:hypothetical protein HMPREF1982_04653 [Clostridiales bacterium oral taxon 876 str. F0540]